ncbi:MAG TPA: VOC family protein [Caldisericia bacterium]|nr:VOC family protein [Caldisericia bacterium]HPF49417.1 VOC family protein [Caldisericia bacterium]HPI84380.1 VOC family protein [Caldisericia bacterium]HPQ93588.1 VOC family protein [Caldisericia bacterium]HRV75557.1 VOC family protein [Caldisericia bacterium]
MPKVVHFELVADDPERATKFFESAFDWQIKNWEGPMDYWLCNTGKEGEPGIHGAIMRNEKGAFNNIVIGVDDLDGYMDRVKKAGGELVTEKMPIPGVGWFCYFKDTEGNVIGMMQDDPEAK